LSFLGVAGLQKLEIIDRYLAAAESNRTSLRKFMEALATIWQAPPAEIVFRHGPSRNPSERTQWIREAEEIIRQLRGDARFANAKITSEFRGHSQARNFHDRRIVAHFGTVGAPNVAAAGDQEPRRRRRQGAEGAPLPRRRIAAELTGGIDVFMDVREETTLYVFEEAVA
jgi:hypothetical protein